MPKKIEYILAGLILLTLTLITGACTIYPTPTPTPPQPNNSNPHTNPDWTFPSENKPPVISLPDFPPVIARAIPSVVSVTTERTVSSLFGEYTQPAAGSGVIIDDEGYIVTNNHVIEDAQNIYVDLNDGRTFPAYLVGTDVLTDLAVIKVDAANLPYAYWGNSASLSIGDWVIAIGNALGEGITATEGIVSRLNVSVDVGGNTLYGLIQTTAAINPGNSGGPLVNMAAEVIGITSVKMAAVGVEGMGYAISSDEAKLIIPDLIHHGHVTYPWLGVGLYTVDASVAATLNLSVDKGALIVELVDNSPADLAGLRVDDVIIRFGNKEITNVADLVQAIRSSQIGQEVEITSVRGEETKTTSATLIERPTPQD